MLLQFVVFCKVRCGVSFMAWFSMTAAIVTHLSQLTLGSRFRAQGHWNRQYACRDIVVSGCPVQHQRTSEWCMVMDCRTLKRSVSEDSSPPPSKRFFRSFSTKEGGHSSMRNGHPRHARRKQQACSLPIFPARQALIAEIRSRTTVVIVGETGSGKTTQIPQYLYEGKLAKLGTIACTQPRRVAAISIANRVAREMGVQIGQEVGFTVRFEDVTSEKTKIKYMTDGMLLREAIQDPLLRNYSVVILDEAHERTVHTDVLFGVVKAAQKMRQEKNFKPLRIVVMSATLDAEHFAEYFGHAKVLYIEGRQYPVHIMYTLEVQTDYLHAAFVTAMQLHREKPPG